MTSGEGEGKDESSKSEPAVGIVDGGCVAVYDQLNWTTLG
jgi:hypothetical protein